MAHVVRMLDEHGGEDVFNGRLLHAAVGGAAKAGCVDLAASLLADLAAKYGVGDDDARGAKLALVRALLEHTRGVEAVALLDGMAPPTPPQATQLVLAAASGSHAQLAAMLDLVLAWTHAAKDGERAWCLSFDAVERIVAAVPKQLADSLDERLDRLRVLALAQATDVTEPSP